MLVRLGLKNSIRWADYEMEVVGEADNGITALELFRRLKPDVLITDIKMGGMDGYELIRRVRDIDGSCAIVIISCLDDFETLRKMMGYCIIGYILKASMTFEEIGDVLKRTKQYLENIRRQQAEPEPEEERKRGRVFAAICAAPKSRRKRCAGWRIGRFRWKACVLWCSFRFAGKTVGRLTRWE